MKPALIVSVIALTVVGNAMAAAQEKQREAVETPLDKVWGYDMPGTRDIRELEPDKFGDAVKKLNSAEQVRVYKESLISQILEPLRPLKRGQTTKPGFAVAGTGIEALREAHAVMIRGKKPSDTFPANSHLSIVFSSHPFSSSVHIHEVVRRGNVIEIQYRFVPHETREFTTQFALIPVGKLSPGEVKVEMVQLPMEKQFVDAGFRPVDKAWESQVVCLAFQFEIKGGNAD